MRFSYVRTMHPFKELRVRRITPESHYFISVYKFNVFETLLKIRTAASRLNYCTFMGAIINRRHGIRNDRFVRAKFVRVIRTLFIIICDLIKKKRENNNRKRVFKAIF